MTLELLLLIGFGINLFSLIHFSLRGGFKFKLVKIILTLMILLIPAAGSLIYFICYLWAPPTSSSNFIRGIANNENTRTFHETYDD